jgi:hypothetical protein
MTPVQSWEALRDQQTWELGRRLPVVGWDVPRWVSVREERLEYRYIGLKGSSQQRWVRPQREFLEKFLQLAEAPAEKILAYARNWGVLEICEHNLPASHQPGAFPSDSGVPGCRPLQTEEGRWWEPLDAWRRLARRLQGLLNVATGAYEGRASQRRDWERIVPDEPEEQLDNNTVQSDRFSVAYYLNWEVRLARVRLRCIWDGDVPDIKLGGDGLYAALVVQTVYAVNQSEGIATCTACGSAYAPKRQPNPNRARYCDACRKTGAPERAASRAYRARLRKAL